MILVRKSEGLRAVWSNRRQWEDNITNEFKVYENVGLIPLAHGQERWSLPLDTVINLWDP
jgi:hypothetical protein